MDVRVPKMIIKLKQGIGRLIRNFTDTGIVCIIDRRLRDEPPERYHDITWHRYTETLIVILCISAWFSVTFAEKIQITQ